MHRLKFAGCVARCTSAFEIIVPDPSIHPEYYSSMHRLKLTVINSMKIFIIDIEHRRQEITQNSSLVRTKYA